MERRPKIEDELEQLAQDYLKANKDREGTKKPVTSRELAKAIGCAHGRISGLLTWRALMARRREGKTVAPKAVALTDDLLANTDQSGRIGRSLTTRHRDDDDSDDPDDRGGELQRAMDEHHEDYEPSPLDDDPPEKPHHIKHRKRP